MIFRKRKAGALELLAEKAEGRFADWQRGGELPAVAPPEGEEKEVGRDRLRRSLLRLLKQPDEIAGLRLRLGAAEAPSEAEMGRALSSGCASLRAGISRLEDGDVEAAGRFAAEARASANTVEAVRRASLGPAAERPPLEAMKLEAVLAAYSRAADALERAALDLAACAASQGEKG